MGWYIRLEFICLVAQWTIANITIVQIPLSNFLDNRLQWIIYIINSQIRLCCYFIISVCTSWHSNIDTLIHDWPTQLFYEEHKTWPFWAHYRVRSHNSIPLRERMGRLGFLACSPFIIQYRVLFRQQCQGALGGRTHRSKWLCTHWSMFSTPLFQNLYLNTWWWTCSLLGPCSGFHNYLHYM